ncbi:hypothetical protein R1flu_010460 [Riccia fluitans]|uniref:Uncharacterized protein n=1 Tax=Riccia fluitans TaxID=41844 RepID=A0ABD1Z5Y2_9MARC
MLQILQVISRNCMSLLRASVIQTGRDGSGGVFVLLNGALVWCSSELSPLHLDRRGRRSFIMKMAPLSRPRRRFFLLTRCNVVDIRFIS